MIEQVFTIARNTFTESIRQPIFLVILAAASAMLVLNLGLSAYTLSEDDKLLIDLGLSTIFLGGLFLAAFTATGVLAREIENKTVLTVISKPIGRPAFVLGKYLGVVGAIFVACLIWAIIFLLTVRQEVLSTARDQLDGPVMLFGFAAAALAIAIAVWGNYFYKWVFTSRLIGLLLVLMPLAYLMVLMIDKQWHFQPITAEFTSENSQLGLVMVAIGLVVEALAVVTAIAIACSTRLGQVMTLVICLAIFMLGLSSDYMFGRLTDTQPLWWIGYALAPNMQYHWLADALTQNHPASLRYVGLVTAYSTLYAAGVLCLATALFQTRETG